MWMNLMDHIARRFCTVGELRLTYPNGETRTYGSRSDIAATMTIRTNAALRKLCIRPELSLGEGYMDGSIVFDSVNELEKLLTLLLRNRRPNSFPAYLRLLDRLNFLARGLKHHNTARSARANVAHHYDLSDDLYRLMLDDDMQYSCAYFHQSDLDLEAAQLAKKRYIAQKLLLEKDCHVLDIGCGWGGMALTLAAEYDVRVTGVTLSENQLVTAQNRARERGLSDLVSFRLIDYRKLNEPFDRIVSVGMLEHVGLPHYSDFFSQVANLLAPDGIALIHTIGRISPPKVTSPWINKYIFPGGYIPSLSELMPALEASGLWQTDIEIWRRHYALTLREWRRRFTSNIEQIRVWYDDRFIRMWNYYLTACILAFEEQGQAVYQLQLAHNRDSVPITRNYLYQASPAQGLLPPAGE